MIALLLCDSDDTVWMEEPGYAGARHAFRSAGARIGGIRVDEHGAVPAEDVQGLEEDARVLYLGTFPRCCFLR